MPKGLVKTKADEKKWKEDKKAIGNNYKGKIKWKVIKSIYQKKKASKKKG
jgi:hypothetical protein